MAGTFANFYFDDEVFAEYMAEQPTWANAIIASGILRQDASLMELIGEKGNVATLPFYKALSIDDFVPKNNDGLTDNTPSTLSGGKQTAMLIQRMRAWSDKDFTRELTGANPLQHVADSVNNYYQQVWQAELMGMCDAVLGVSGVSNHVYDISATSPSSASDITEDNKIDETTLIFAEQKALGDMAGNFGMLIMHSAILARYKALGLIDYVKYNEADGLTREVNLPTINGLVVLVSDRGTVNASGTVPVYKTTIIGEGAFLTAEKTNYEKPYYMDYDPEDDAGINKLYTKQGRVLHPNGFSLDVSEIATDSPSTSELGTTANWSLAFNEKNVRIGQIISNG